MEAVMSLVLALNRLKVICQLQYPQAIHKIILIVVWTLGATQYCLLYTPWCGYDAKPGVFSTHYNMSKPYSYELQLVGSYIMMGSFAVSLVIYAIIIVYLLRTQIKVGLKSSFQKEKHLLVYAGIRFVVDVSLAISFNYGHFPAVPIVDFPILLGYVLNNFFLPPVLYLALNRSLREHFLKIGSNTVKVTSAVNTVF
ncbi:hypothetical protein L596_026881 [Steinernema carpocapsae]|uniref:Uncharacterized protein n=1 Tax=Steinernema carpocapsae TaxID=34508 RepID=A0A4U5M2N4_STECR|nr:hypothetical protein L596_026881 [Steinernema carpocapsae]